MLAMLTLSATYTAAQEIVAFLRNNDVWDGAFYKLNEFVGTERAEVAEKAIALGADPAIIQTLLASSQPSEVIEVTSTAPKSPAKTQIPWFWILLAALAIGGGLYYYRKKRG